MYLLFITSNQQYSFIFARIEKYSQYVFKPPYNTMQTIRLLQHNPAQNQFPTSQVYIEFYKFLIRIYFAQAKLTTFRKNPKLLQTICI